MFKLAITLCILNTTIALLTATPCLIGATMSMDSPQAQQSTQAHITMWLILTFPLTTLTTGILSPLLHPINKYLTLIALTPYLQPITILIIALLNQ